MTWFKETKNDGNILACKWLYDNYGNSILVKFELKEMKQQLGLYEITTEVQ